MAKAVVAGILVGWAVYLLSELVLGMKTHIGGDLFAAAWTAATIARNEERSKALRPM